MQDKALLIYILASSVPLSIMGVLLQRLIEGKGIGVRAIQFVAATSILPIIAILALEKIIDGCTVSALVGALIGYLFSNISEFEKKLSDKENAETGAKKKEQPNK